MANSIIALGEAIMWGQGLNAGDKFIHKVKEKLQENLPHHLERSAPLSRTRTQKAPRTMLRKLFPKSRTGLAFP